MLVVVRYGYKEHSSLCLSAHKSAGDITAHKFASRHQCPSPSAKKLFEGPHMCQAAVLAPVPDDCHVWLKAVRARWPIFSAALRGESRRHWLPSRTAQGCLTPQMHNSPAHYTIIKHVCLQMSHCYMSPSSGFHCFSRPQAHAATSVPGVCSVRASHKLRAGCHRSGLRLSPRCIKAAAARRA